MKNSNIYAGYRYPAQIISHAVWLYHRFTLSFRDIEELLAARGVVVSYETIRQWCKKYGSIYCNQIKKSCGVIKNLFRPGRHLMQAKHYRIFRDPSFIEWDRVSCIQNLI